MTDLTRDDIMKLARLARIEVTEDEVAQYRQELSKVLEYMELLQSADVSQLTPTSQVTGLSNIMRDDEPVDYGYTADDLLAGTLSVEDRQIKVRRMLQ